MRREQGKPEMKPPQHVAERAGRAFGGRISQAASPALSREADRGTNGPKHMPNTAVARGELYLFALQKWAWMCV